MNLIIRESSEVEKSEKEAREAYPELVHLKSDIVAGEHGSLLTYLAERIVRGESIYFSQASGSKQASPVSCDNVEASVEAALKDSKHKGKSYLLQGPQPVTLNEIFDTLARATNKTPAFKSGTLESIISPLSVNLLSEKLYSYDYINAMRFLENYKAPAEANYGKMTELGVTPQEFGKLYTEIKTDRWQNTESGMEKAIKQFLY